MQNMYGVQNLYLETLMRPDYSVLEHAGLQGSWKLIQEYIILY